MVNMDMVDMDVLGMDVVGMDVVGMDVVYMDVVDMDVVCLFQKNEKASYNIASPNGPDSKRLGLVSI